MKKKVNKKYKDFVKDCCRKAAWNIGVSHFLIDVHYMGEPKTPDRGADYVINAEMTTDRRYLKGILKLYPSVEEMWEKGEKDNVKHAVFHEMAHLATQHVMDLMTACYKDEGETKDAWETITEIIGRMALVIDTHNDKK